MAFGDTTVPMQLAAFNDDRMPVAVLAHVWRQHHNARTPLLRWLNELAISPQPDMWVRAAQAAGLLCALDFADVFHELLDGWGSADDTRRRIVAALALDQAASNPEARPAVQYVLDRWKHKGNEARRWTAAVALGRSLVLDRTENSLGDLLALGTWREDEGDPVANVASDSIARLLALGGIETVLHRLFDWLDSRRQSVRDVALLAIIKAANIKVGEFDDIEFFTSGAGQDRWPMLASRDSWPLLLALQDEDAQLAEPFADLLWHALDTARSRSAAQKALTTWIRCGEKDRSCLLSLIAFLRLLAEDPGSARRLQHLVNNLRAQWEEPLANDVADYLLKHALADSRNGVRTP
ncbi:MAG: hypothetical protein M3460_16600 [Actinomycetota bacterium]|nr:hypothetical protein [Actinomycetota bacterium]